VAPAARPAANALAPRRYVSFEFAPADTGQRVILYGGAGVGKTTLADLAPGPVVSIDLDDSLAALRPLHTQRVADVETWEELHDALLGDGWDGVGTICLDSATKAEELCIKHVLKTVSTGSGKATSLESYPYGKGTVYLAEAWLPLLADLDTHVRAGRHVIVICHECKETVPNPGGVDFLRFAPRLSSPKNDNNSLRLRTIEWSDHCLWIHSDEAISAEGGRGTGRAVGSGTRTLYPVGMPWYIAKSRCRDLNEPLVLKPGDDSVWRTIFGESAEQ
jgi:hypothetical protein